MALKKKNIKYVSNNFPNEKIVKMIRTDTFHYNKKCPYTPCDFIGFWVNSVVIVNGT
jgi:hypothetical protein